MIDFGVFMSRFDDSLLQSLLGAPSLKLIGAIDPGLATRSNLIKLVVDLYTPSGLLLSKGLRNQIFEILTFEEAVTLSAQLKLRYKGDPFDALKGASISRGSARENTLLQFFGLDPIEQAEHFGSPAITKVSGRYELFDYQRRAVYDILGYLSGRSKRVVLHMPTGSGKTRTAMNVIAEHLRAKEPTLVIWLANSQELCEQAAAEFETAWASLGNREITISRFWENFEIDVDSIKDGFVVAGLAKIYQSLTKDVSIITRLGRKSSLVVIDEAHAAVAETYQMILDALVAQRSASALLGLTATPGRSWLDMDADRELASFFDFQKVSLKIPGFDSPVDFLVQQGYLAKTVFRQLFHAGGSSINSEDLKAIQANLDIPYNVLAKLAEDEQRNLRIIAEIESLALVHSRIILFAATVEHAQLLAAVLRARGLHARSITSRSTSTDRSAAIRQFKEVSQDVRILCNYGVLTTGFDAPRTSAAVIARPTKSLVLYSQMIGRAIRGLRAGGNATAEIVTVIDHSLPGFRSVAESFNHWEDIWE